MSDDETGDVLDGVDLQPLGRIGAFREEIRLIRAALSEARQERDAQKKRADDWMLAGTRAEARLHIAQEALALIASRADHPLSGDVCMCDKCIARRALAEPPGETTGAPHEERSKDWRCDLKCAGGPCKGCEPAPVPASDDNWAPDVRTDCANPSHGAFPHVDVDGTCTSPTPACAEIVHANGPCGRPDCREPAPASRDSTRGTAAAKTCWAWCGFNCQHPDICGKKVHFCTKACAAAGKPLHPATPPSTRGTCGTCAGSKRVKHDSSRGLLYGEPCPDCAPRSEESK